MKKAYSNPTTIEEAVTVCTPFVNKLAHKWKRNHYQEFTDLQQAGFCGVCEAWGRFDTEKNVRFTTYAWWWIRAYIRDYAMKKWEYNNNTAVEEAMVYGDNGYEMNDRLLSALREIEKLPSRDRQMYQMRMEGYTFDEIAQTMGEDSLHKVRNHLQQINEHLEGA